MTLCVRCAAHTQGTVSGCTAVSSAPPGRGAAYPPETVWFDRAVCFRKAAWVVVHLHPHAPHARHRPCAKQPRRRRRGAARRRGSRSAAARECECARVTSSGCLLPCRSTARPGSRCQRVLQNTHAGGSSARDHTSPSPTRRAALASPRSGRAAGRTEVFLHGVLESLFPQLLALQLQALLLRAAARGGGAAFAHGGPAAARGPRRANRHARPTTPPRQRPGRTLGLLVLRQA